MGLIDWLTRRVTQNISTTNMIVGGAPIYPDPLSITWVEDGYCGNTAIYTIVSHSAKKFANIPRLSYKPETGAKACKDRYNKKEFKSSVGESIGGDLDMLLKRPNPFIGGDLFWEAIYTSYDLQGEAFIWLNRGDIDIHMDDKARMKIKPLEMLYLPPHYVELIPDPTDVWAILGYAFNVGGQMIPIAKSDIIHWRKYNPNFDAKTRIHLRGFSPLTPGRKLMTADDASIDAMVGMFQNDGAKGIIFNETLDNLTPQQSAAVRDVIDRKINNKQTTSSSNYRHLKGSVASLQGKWGYIDLGGTSVDMELLKAQSLIFERLCNLFRVSPNLFISGQTRDNLREARKELITGKIMPDATSLDDEINRQFKYAWPELVVMSDFSSLPEMQYEMDFINNIYEKMWMKGIVNGDEWRLAMGFDETGLAEHRRYFITGQVTPVEEAGLPIMEDDGQDGEDN